MTGIAHGWRSMKGLEGMHVSKGYPPGWVALARCMPCSVGTCRGEAATHSLELQLWDYNQAGVLRLV